MPATPTPTVTVTQLVTPSPSPTLVQIVSTPPKHGPDWGTVPVWVGAVLTAGSLLLGFYIILRDRWKSEKEQASKVAYWVTNSHEREGYLATVNNGSESPIYGVGVLRQVPTLGCQISRRGLLLGVEHALFKSPRSNNIKLREAEVRLGAPIEIQEVLQPTASSGAYVLVDDWDIDKHLHYHLCFTDNANQAWIRCPSTGRTSRAPRSNVSVSRGAALLLAALLLTPVFVSYVVLTFPVRVLIDKIKLRANPKANSAA